VSKTEEADFKEAAARAEELLKGEEPRFRREPHAYSKTARSAFRIIQKARADGFSFVQICGAFEEAGLLPKKALPHSLRQAFYREAIRKKRGRELSEQIKKAAGGEENTGGISDTSIKVERANEKPEAKNALLDNSGKFGKDAELERIRMMTARVADNGFGKITTFADGGFDYD
jgi:ribosomal protein RSM22 (predicted rRNA methylase)